MKRNCQEKKKQKKKSKKKIKKPTVSKQMVRLAKRREGKAKIKISGNLIKNFRELFKKTRSVIATRVKTMKMETNTKNKESFPKDL